MDTPFFQSGPAIFDLAAWGTPEVCPDTPLETRKASQWAKEALNFTPSAKQAEILDLDAKYLMLCCNRQWGKTTTIALKALHHALSHNDQSIVILSRTKLQAGILIERATNFAARLGHKIRRVLGHQYSLKLPNGSRIFAVAHNTDTSVGGTANVLIVDEAALVQDEVYWSVSPYVGRTKGAIWLLSTPRRQVGFFYNFWHDRDPQWTKIFSTVDDCPTIQKDFLDLHKRANPRLFEQEFYCKFKPAPGALVSRDFIRRAYDPALSARKLPPLRLR